MPSHSYAHFWSSERDTASFIEITGHAAKYWPGLEIITLIHVIVSSINAGYRLATINIQKSLFGEQQKAKRPCLSVATGYKGLNK